MFDEPSGRAPGEDELLDSLLAEHSAAEPRVGLEARVLAGVKAHAARQQRRVFAVAASAAVLLLAVYWLSPRVARLNGSGRPGSHPQPTEKIAGSGAGASTPAPNGLQRQAVSARRPRPLKRVTPPNLLQLVDALHGPGSLPFESEESYLAPGVRQESEIAPQPQTAAGIIVPDIGVPPIAVKELNPSEVEKGRL